MIKNTENFEIENRKVEFGIPIEMLGSDLTAEDLAPETSKKEVFNIDINLKSCHVSVREGLPF